MQTDSDRLKRFLSRQDWRCTCWPNGNWKACCVKHDYMCADAACMQSESYRKKADKKLRKCVNQKTSGMGDIMFIGVRGYAVFKKFLTGNAY